jgi:hypothetical protein
MMCACVCVCGVCVCVCVCVCVYANPPAALACVCVCLSLALPSPYCTDKSWRSSYNTNIYMHHVGRYRYRKAGREMEFPSRTESQFSTELPFTRGSFTDSVRDHNLREASHLYYEGEE